MLVKNVHTAPLVIGGAEIAPGAEHTLDANSMKMAGVAAWIKAGILVEAKAKKADDK